MKSPMRVMPSGMVIETRPVATNTASPISFRESGNMMLVMAEQSLKASVSILVTVLGSFTVTRLEHLLNMLSPTTLSLVMSEPL